MIPHTERLFEELYDDYEIQSHSERSQLQRGLADDEEFLRMMEGPTANGGDSRRLRPSTPTNSETLNSSTCPNVGSEVALDLEVNVIDADCQSMPSKKRKRKTRKSRGKNKLVFGIKGAETLQFNEIGQAVAPRGKVAQLGRFLGQLVRECTNFPLNAKNWGEICKSGNVEAAWATVHDALDWSDPGTLAKADDIKEVILEKLHERYRSFKYKLKKQWYKPYKGMERRHICGNKHVHPGQWRALVMKWDETKTEEVAETNATNRQALKLHQTTGTRTYAQMRYEWELEHPGEVLDRVTFFGLTYTSSKKDPTNPQPSNQEARKKFDAIQEHENNIRNEGREVTNEDRNEIFTLVMGPEKHNRVRGYGVGATWADVPGIVTQKNGLKHQVKALRDANEAQRAENERREATLAQKLKESAEREMALQTSYEQIRKKVDSLEAQVVTNPLSNMFAAAGIDSLESLDLSRLITFMKKPDDQMA